MRYQVFIPIALLQALNLFWYFLILRILVRCVTFFAILFFSVTLTPRRTVVSSQTEDVRSDDEDDEEDEQPPKPNPLDEKKAAPRAPTTVTEKVPPPVTKSS
jgi:hypothetical protein